MLSSLVNKYGIEEVLESAHTAGYYASEKGLKTWERARITDEFKKFGFVITKNSNNQIYIHIPVFHDFRDMTSQGMKYILGFSNGQYWIRWQNGLSQSVLNYNRKTGEYGFVTFDDMFEYFRSFFYGKYKDRLDK